MRILAIFLLVRYKDRVLNRGKLLFVVDLNLLVNALWTTRLEDLLAEVVSWTFLTWGCVKVPYGGELMDVALRNLLANGHYVVVGPSMHVAAQENLACDFNWSGSCMAKWASVTLLRKIISLQIHAACQPGLLSCCLTILFDLRDLDNPSDLCAWFRFRYNTSLSLVDWVVFLVRIEIELGFWSLRHLHIVDRLFIKLLVETCFFKCKSSFAAEVWTKFFCWGKLLSSHYLFRMHSLVARIDRKILHQST